MSLPKFFEQLVVKPLVAMGYLGQRSSSKPYLNFTQLDELSRVPEDGGCLRKPVAFNGIREGCWSKGGIF